MPWTLFNNSSRSKKRGGTQPIFVPAEWDVLISRPDWPLGVPPLMKELNALQEKDPVLYRQTLTNIYDYFEDRLASRKISLARSGHDYDAERKPIDTVVIHHTHLPPGLSDSRLSAIDLFRLYATQYADKEPLQGVYSGHFRYGFQVFWAHHWIVGRNGSVRRLLNDREIGWQAGNWEVNCRSVAIVIEGDYENREPSDAELAAVAKIIQEHYPKVPRENILGHCEVNKKTTCPSRLFLEHDGKAGWKERLLAML